MKTWWKLWCINLHTKTTQAATKNLMAVTVPSLSSLLHPRLLAVVPVTEIKTVRRISSTKVSSAAQRKPIEPSTPWVFSRWQDRRRSTKVSGGFGTTWQPRCVTKEVGWRPIKPRPSMPHVKICSRKLEISDVKSGTPGRNLLSKTWGHRYWLAKITH